MQLKQYIDALAADSIRAEPLVDAEFGGAVRFPSSDASTIISLCEKNVATLTALFYCVRGLLVLRDLSDVRHNPAILVRLSQLFGSEVEDYRGTLTSPRFFHPSESQLLVLSNSPPCNHPPPPLPKGYCPGSDPLPVSFPRQVNWHTDQSYRRPPPDITLLLGLDLPPVDQGQTLFADCAAAYEALDDDLRKNIAGRDGIHAPSWIGRSRQAVESGETPIDLLAHQLPQRHPLVRRHPVSGRDSLFICEEKQMDFVDGPIAGLETGPGGEGARVLRALLRHATQEQFVYTHHWIPGDLVIGDNRNLLHCATWYDSDRYSRLMWRTTVMGNPGAQYAGESKSWIPGDGSAVMQGMEHA